MNPLSAPATLTPPVARIGEANLSYPGWRVVLASHLASAVGFIPLVIYSFSVFLKPIGAEFGWGREEVSRAFACSAITVALASPLLGRWLDRWGPRRVILPCMTALSVTFASLALLTPHLWHLYAIFLLLGMVGNGTTQLAFSRAVSTWFDTRRGVALSLTLAGSGLGGIIVPFLAQALIARYGLRAAFLVLASITFCVGVPLTAWFVRERVQAFVTSTGSGTPALGSTLGEAFRSRAFWLISAILFLSSVGANGAMTHLSALLTDRGITAQSAALAISLLAGAAFTGRLFTGWFLDRFHGARVALVALSALTFGILLLTTATQPLTGCAAAILIGLGLGGESDVTPYLLTRYFGLRAFSTLYGFTFTAFALAGAIGPVLMGRQFDSTGSYSALLFLLTALTGASALLTLFLPRYDLIRPSARES